MEWPVHLPLEEGGGVSVFFFFFYSSGTHMLLFIPSWFV